MVGKENMKRGEHKEKSRPLKSQLKRLYVIVIFIWVFGSSGGGDGSSPILLVGCLGPREDQRFYPENMLLVMVQNLNSCMSNSESIYVKVHPVDQNLYY